MRSLKAGRGLAAATVASTSAPRETIGLENMVVVNSKTRGTSLLTSWRGPVEIECSQLVDLCRTIEKLVAPKEGRQPGQSRGVKREVGDLMGGQESRVPTLYIMGASYLVRSRQEDLER